MMHDSYLIIPAFLAPDETDALLNRSRSLLDEFSLQDHPLVRLNSYQILITLPSYPRFDACMTHDADEVHHRRRKPRR
jgi:hypothetical protein